MVRESVPASLFYKSDITPPSRRVFTFGYQGHDRAALIPFLWENDGVLVDVRLSPGSRNPEWSNGQLVRDLGDRYVHVPSLGNVNFRSGGPIQLRDPEAGIRAVEKLAAKHGVVVVMCTCADYCTCHRRQVAELLRERGMAVEELR